MTETVPADIAAAIDRFEEEAQLLGGGQCRFSENEAARAALNAAILKHLRGIDEMKAALELQTSGAA
jgi:hypothetical protein